MSNRITAILGSCVALLLVGYVSLVVLTVWRAAWQTQLSVQIHETEQEISRLERQYYDAIAVLDRADPATYGLTKPIAVRYATGTTRPTVTLR